MKNSEPPECSHGQLFTCTVTPRLTVLISTSCVKLVVEPAGLLLIGWLPRLDLISTLNSCFQLVKSLAGPAITNKQAQVPPENNNLW